MYRISSPNLIKLLIVIVIGSLFTSATPGYFGGTRVLSFVSLIIGEMGMSFIPVIALYPKANPTQSIILAVIFFITTFIVCVSSWAINSLGWPGSFSFQWKDGEFFVNTYSLFVSNIVSLIFIIMNFKLVYDEELTKDAHRGRNRPNFKKPILRRPLQSSSSTSLHQDTLKPKSSPTQKQKDESDDFGKPFDFTPQESEITQDNLPEESSGSLFSRPEEIKEQLKTFDFEDSLGNLEEFSFSNEQIQEESIKEQEVKKPEKIEKPKPINLESSVKIPADIKNDLAAIFEQYSSLNAVKKITSEVSDKHKYKREKRRERVSIKVNDPDIQEAIFAPVSEIEELEKIKENLKEDLRNELKEELIQSIKGEIKQAPIQTDVIQETKKQYKPTMHDSQMIKTLNELSQVQGSFILSTSGDILLEEWKNQPENIGNIKNSICNLFMSFNLESSKTNQGTLNHLILEDNNGAYILANRNDNILCVHSQGTGDTFSGQILRVLTELEDSEDDE